jgi:metallo-beta-lactamase family protein
MAHKKLKHDGIQFLGKSSDDVTGSQYYICYNGKQILLECGLHQSQSNDYLDSYKINSERFKFKPSEIDYVFAAHPHIDHVGLIPRLVKYGFHGKIITTKNTAAVMSPLLLNSCAIVQDEARVLSKRYGREYEPLYSEDDVYTTLSLIWVFDEYDTEITLDDTVSFKWFKNSHCVGAAQLLIILAGGSQKRHVLYTSDLGSLKTNNHYVVDTEIPEDFADVVIMESTYGSSARTSKKTRDFDREHLKSEINTTLGRNGTIILPCFSFSRTQEILTTLFELYHDDKDFDIPVIVDSVLSCDICDLYYNMLSGDDLSLWYDVCSWKNVQFVREKEESGAIVEDTRPKIVISSSGFCTNGRVVRYLQKYLKDPNSTIIFSGYTGDNPSYLSYKIKNYRNHKFISINKEKVLNKADCITLRSFSSHANHDDLVEYGSSLNTNKVVLVHGSAESKKCLAQDLTDAISKNNKTYKVISANRGLIINL